MKNQCLENFFNFFDWLNWRRFQKIIYQNFDRIIGFSDEDCKIIQRVAPRNKISIIPIGIDFASYKLSESDEKPIDILFMGHMLHYPNIDGLHYFNRKIFPLIKKGIPNVKFCIIGSSMKKANFKLKKDKNIEVIGEVEDIRPYLLKTKVMVVPVRLGAGIKVKILEAMAMGVPVVATRVAAKGLKAIPGESIYIADSTKDFMCKVVSLLQDEPKRMAMAKNAREVIEKYYDANKIFYQEESLYESLMLRDTRVVKEQPMFTNQLVKEHKQSLTGDGCIVAAWDILFRCNYRCPYCFNEGKWEQLEVYNKPYTHEDWLSFWDSINQKYGEITIIVSGGEPFIYPGFMELMKKMVLMHRIEICTNLAIDINKIINEFSPKQFILRPSFHPYNADLDEFIKKIYTLKQKGWDLRPIIVAYPPILNKLIYFKKRFSEMDIDIFVLPFIGQYQNIKYPQGYTNSERRFISSLSNKEYIKYQLNSINPKGRLCKTGFRYFKLFPNGSIIRCASSNNILGNIEDKNFQLLEEVTPCEVEFCICNNESLYLDDNMNQNYR